VARLLQVFSQSNSLLDRKVYLYLNHPPHLAPPTATVGATNRGSWWRQMWQLLTASLIDTYKSVHEWYGHTSKNADAIRTDAIKKGIVLAFRPIVVGETQIFVDGRTHIPFFC